MIAPSDFQSMGFGLPAAIGAALAAPGRPVVGLIGDGGLAMSGLELLTAVREQIPVTIIVFTDGSLGLIREQQIREFGRTHGVDLGAMNLEALAAAVGARYRRLGDGDPVQLLGSALPRGDESRGGAEGFSASSAAPRVGPVLIEVPVGDSLALRRQHVAGYTRAAVRRALGPRLLQTVKRWLR
jgi:hypothetical protein